MTASIDGQAFSADSLAKATASKSVAGQYELIGEKISGSQTESIALTLYNISATGTFPLGVGLTAFGGTGIVGEATNAYYTPLNGTAGTVTISTLTSTRIGGTFSFVAADLTNPSSVKNVTSGVFDLPITNTPLAVPASKGSGVSATVGGAPWVGATIAVISHTGGTYGFGATSAGSYQLTFGLTGVNAPGTYAFNVNTSTGIVADKGSQSWNYDTLGSTGMFTVTSVNANRIQGTFSGTLGVASGGGTPLTITNGKFDIGH